MKKVKKILFIFVLILSLSTPSAVPLIGTAETVAAAVKISNKKITLIKGQKKQLKITGASEAPKWSSSNKSVADVTNKGIVTAKKKGSSIITAQVGDSEYTCTVYVQTPAINKTSQAVTAGKKVRLSMKGTNAKVTWKSSNKNIASVSSTGSVTGKRAGSCTIYATVLGKTYKCRITVKAPAAQNQSVWLSATGSKYHKIPNCGRMNPSKARKVTLNAAKSRGFSPCKNCF